MGKNRAFMEDVAKVAAERHYSKDAVSNILLICCSTQMLEHGYTPERALKKALELIESGGSKASVYTELLKMAGYEG